MTSSEGAAPTPVPGVGVHAGAQTVVAEVAGRPREREARVGVQRGGEERLPDAVDPAVDDHGPAGMRRRHTAPQHDRAAQPEAGRKRGRHAGAHAQAHVRLRRRLAGGLVRDAVVGGDGRRDGEAERAVTTGRRGRRRRPDRGAGRQREQRERGAGYGGRAADGRGARVDDVRAGDRRGERHRLRGGRRTCEEERGSADGQQHGHQREQVRADGHGQVTRTGRERQGSAGAGEADAGATEADGDAAGVSDAPRRAPAKAWPTATATGSPRRAPPA